MPEIKQPFDVFTDLKGEPLENGYLYIGEPGLEPSSSPISIYFDSGFTIPAPNPLRTIAGYPSRNGSPARVFIKDDDYSLIVRDKKGSLVYSSISGNSDSVLFDSVQEMQASLGLQVGQIAKTGVTKWRIVSTVSTVATANGYAVPISNVWISDWGLDDTGSTLHDTEITEAINAAKDGGVKVKAGFGSFLIRNVQLTLTTAISGMNQRETTFVVDDNIATNKGFYREEGTIATCSIVLKDFTLAAKTSGNGYGLSLTKLAFVKTENIQYFQLLRGENFTDVLISRFDDSYFNGCVFGSWGFGDEGLNVNIYDHPITRNCTDAFYIDGNPANANNTYGIVWRNGDFEYNERAITILASGQSPHRAENCTFEGDSDTPASANEVKVTGTGKLDIVDPLVGDIASPASTEGLLSSDSDGQVFFLGRMGKQTSALRVRCPALGAYNGGDFLRDAGLTDLPVETALRKLKRQHLDASCVSGTSGVLGYITGVAPRGVKRTSSFEHSVGWGSGTSTLVADPIGGTTAFEVTAQAIMSATIPTTGLSVLTFFAQCTRSDSGSVDVTVDSLSTGTIAAMSLNYNGPTNWQFYHIPIDADSLSGFDGNVRLILPARSGIRYWGQQFVSGTDKPVPFLRFNEDTLNGMVISDLKTSRQLNQSFKYKASSVSTSTVVTTQTLASSADGTIVKQYRAVIQGTFGGQVRTDVYHIALSYTHSWAVGDAVDSVSVTSLGGTALATRVTVGVTSATAASDKAITFTTTDFHNELQIKLEPIW